MPMFDISASIVLYKNDPTILFQAIDSFLKTDYRVKLYLVDNSPSNQLSGIVKDPRVEYIFTGSNLGFGKAHNIAIRKALIDSMYYLVLNPDVAFPEGSLEALHSFMESNKSIGLVTPKVLSFDGEMQYLCKRLPLPANLFLRRFGFSFLRRLLKNSESRYEMRDKNYSQQFKAPTMSGCFMFFRSTSLREIGLFDERYFMYMEDIDISRRMFVHHGNVYYPAVSIYHRHERESYRINRLLFVHILSAIKYFNKWGWFFDSERRAINKNS